MQLPIACTLTGTAREKRETAIHALFSGAERVDLVTGGLEVIVDGAPERLRQIVDIAAAERECCRFLRFEVTAEPDMGPIRLRITGPPGTSEFLRTWVPT